LGLSSEVKAWLGQQFRSEKKRETKGAEKKLPPPDSKNSKEKLHVE